jgi:hypothetical protein
MNKQIRVLTFAILFLITGSLGSAMAQGQAGATPVITQAFSSKEIRPGETWKIYLNASDPNGHMKNIFAVVYQPGVGQYPASIIRIKEQDQKELSGYIYLWTKTPWHPMDYVNLSVTVQIQDKTGNFSEPVGFLLSLAPRGSQEAPPQGMFKEQELGPIMVRLKTVDGGGAGGGGGSSEGGR